MVTSTQSVEQRSLKMIFTTAADSATPALGKPEDPAAATTAPFESFASEAELAALAATWPADRLVAIWNSLPGVTPVKKMKDAKTATSRIWARIQSLGDAAKPKAAKPATKAARKATGRAEAAKGAPAKGKATKKATAAKNAPKAKKGAKPQPTAKQDDGPREGSKTAQVVAMLQRKNGATLVEIMERMGWQRHTVRGFYGRRDEE